MFPTEAEKNRSREIEDFFALYKGNFGKVLHYFRNEKERKSHLEVVQNVAGMISRVFADMMFTEEPEIFVAKSAAQPALDDFIFRNDLYNKLHESAITQSYAGAAYFETYLRDGKVYLTELNPANVFPQYNQMFAQDEPQSIIVSWEPKIGNDYYRMVKTHTVGRTTYELSKLSGLGGKVEGVAPLAVLDTTLPPVEETQLDYIPLYCINNVKTGREAQGSSDYADLLGLFEELTRVQSQVATQLKKHANAKLAVPLGVLNERGEMKNEDAEVFEVPSEKEDGFVIPQYITNGNPLIEAAFTQQEKIIEAIARVSEVSTVLIDWNVAGGAERVGALRLRLLRTSSKVKRKLRPYSRVLKDIIVDALNWEGYQVAHQDVTIRFGDGLPQDALEAVQVESIRMSAGLQTMRAAIANLDPELGSEQVEVKVAQITKEKADALANAMNNAPVIQF
jgi:hypothetical protein